jgi:hypothetical protein
MHAAARAFIAKTGGNRRHSAVDRRLGGVRRKPGASRRRLAYSRSGGILSDYGNCLDYPIETIGSMDTDWLISGRFVTRELQQLY